MDQHFKYDRADFTQLLARTASALAHDIRAPLRHTGQFLEFYERDLAAGNAESAAEHLLIVKESINHTYSMIDSLIHFARAGRSLSEPEPVDLRKLMTTTADRVRLALDIEKVDVSFEGDEIAHGHVGPLMELVYQLIENSAVYVGPDISPEIAFKGTQTDEGYELVVSDNGPGIKEGYEEIAFDLFQKVEADSRSTGPGMGLALARRIAELHGGSLDIVTNSTDDGLTLRLFLPAQ